MGSESIETEFIYQERNELWYYYYYYYWVFGLRFKLVLLVLRWLCWYYVGCIAAARKYGSGWIEQVILIGWKCSATLTVKLNYMPNKNTNFFLLQDQMTNKILTDLGHKELKVIFCMNSWKKAVCVKLVTKAWDFPSFDLKIPNSWSKNIELIWTPSIKVTIEKGQTINIKSK